MNILNLNDYTLLDIFRYLNSTDLWLLSMTCQQLHNFIKTKQIWNQIEIDNKIVFSIEKIISSTKDVRICADGRHSNIIPNYFFEKFSTLNLTVLALENQKIYGSQIKLKDFPQSLIELSWKKTYIADTSEFSKHNPDIFKNLKVLILDQCCWVNGKILHRFGDLKSLEIISLYKCKGLYDVELGMIQTFNQLRIADCRFSGLGNFFLQSLARKPKVQEIYFQNYLTTYFVEKNARDMEIKNSKSKNFKYSYITENDDIPLWNETALHKFVGSTSTTEKVPYGHLTETSTELYATANPIDENYNFHSLLYQRPYEKCTCQNNPDLVTTPPFNEQKLIVSDQDIEKMTCNGGYICTLKQANNTEISEFNQSEKDIAILEHTSPSWIKLPRLWFRMIRPGGLLPTYHREGLCKDYYEPCRVYRCGRAGWDDMRYLKKQNDVSLKKLSLRGCDGVTNKTLEFLKHLNLLLLDITGTKVTEEGIQKFALENVDCRIIHETMCRCRPKLHF
ncbi:uncharacterized protein [Onthophagus taurus]|uniref:uncharacterized protein n=1 Tax=Onthophagus taurus TaxID=166361 RepID=UPI0039BDD09A